MKEKYKHSGYYADHDLDPINQGREITVSLLNISNELAESNHLQKRQNAFLSLIAYALACRLTGSEKSSMQITLKELSDIE